MLPTCSPVHMSYSATLYVPSNATQDFFFNFLLCKALWKAPSSSLSEESWSSWRELLRKQAKWWGNWTFILRCAEASLDFLESFAICSSVLQCLCLLEWSVESAQLNLSAVRSGYVLRITARIFSGSAYSPVEKQYQNPLPHNTVTATLETVWFLFFFCVCVIVWAGLQECQQPFLRLHCLAHALVSLCLLPPRFR